MTYEFRWTSSYMHQVQYRVYGDGEVYLACLRRGADDYEKSIYNHRASDWDTDVVASIGLLHRCDSRRPIAQEVVDAFNAWQLESHGRELAMIEGNPYKYGELASDDPLWIPPAPVRGAYYRVGQGWIVNEPTREAARAA